MKKRIFLRTSVGFLTVLFPLALFPSCRQTPVYSDTKSTTELVSLLETTLDRTDDLVTDGDFLTDYFALPEDVADHTVVYASNRNDLDEYGVFHTSEAGVPILRTALESYLATAYENNRAYYDSYIPTETHKLRDAEVRVYGNYVIYAILDGAERDTLFRTAERELLH